MSPLPAAEPEAHTWNEWHYHNKLTPWTPQMAVASEPDVQRDGAWHYHSKLTPWTPNESLVVAIGVDPSENGAIKV